MRKKFLACIVAFATFFTAFSNLSFGQTGESSSAGDAFSNSITTTDSSLSIASLTTTPSVVGLVAHYDMTKANGKLVDVTNHGFDAPYVGFSDSDFIQDGKTILNFTGNKSKYVKLPNGLIDDETFTIETKFNTSTAANHWLYALGTKNGSWPDVKNYIFLNPKQGDGTMRYGIKDATAEVLFQSAKPNSGEYNTVTAAFEPGKISIYLNGTLVGSIAHSYSVMNILSQGVTNPTDCIGYIGKSLYDPDAAYTGKLADFKVYDHTLNATEVQDIVSQENQDSVNQDYDNLTLGDISAVQANLTLPAKGTFGSAITWTSNNASYITNSGIVTRPAFADGDKIVRLTAVVKKGSFEKSKDFDVKVLAQYTDQQKVDLAASKITLQNTNDIRGNITLPEVTADGLSIVWTADKAGIISTAAIPASANNNYASIPAGVVTRQQTDSVVKLTATVSLNGKTASKDISVTVKAAPAPLKESDYVGYLFNYFAGQSTAMGEQIYFALSTDGLHWNNLNYGDPVLTTHVGEQGVRDPFILRSPEGDKFYMIATDLSIFNNGDWGRAQTSASKSIVIWESTDLVNWSNERLVKIARDDAGCTWAPEAVYDDKTGEYLVFWASRVAEDNYAKQRIYICKTRDFYTFSKPEVYVDRAKDVIDSTMIKYNGMYYRFSKDEVNKNITIDKCDQLLNKAFETVSSPSVGAESGVEGPAIFKFNGQNKWCLLLDNYGSTGYYPLVSDDITSGVFRKLATSEYKMPPGPRHGTVMPITQAEYDALQQKWGVPALPPEGVKQDPILTYNFDEVLSSAKDVADTSGNNQKGKLYGNAVYKQDAEKNSMVLYLDGTSNTYMEFPQSFFDGRNTMTLSMDVKSEMDEGNFFTFAMGKDNSKYMFLKTRPSAIKSVMTVSSWGGEKGFEPSVQAVKGKWMNVKVVIKPSYMALYKDGVMIAENKETGLSVEDMGRSLIAYLGKSFYNGDAYFKGSFDNVKVYNRALTEAEIASQAGVAVQAIKGAAAEGYSFIHIGIDKQNKKISLYIKRGKNLSSVPLEFILTEGATISPAQKTSVNLTKPVKYTVTAPQSQTGEVWTVEAIECNNPVLEGLYADPDIDVFGDTFYIYPTTDGFNGWSGTQFHAFSSKNMLDWKDEGIILDVAKDKDVPWAVGSAWAPTIEAKNGKYYYYFCAKRPDGQSCIGVAVSNSPSGPFKAEANPLITPEIAKAQGTSIGQAIDPSVFTDDNGKSYLLFGNGSAAIVELNDDMISFKPGTMKNISGATDFREAITVVKRNGIYHFTWSCDDTGSENYHVNYGTSSNLYGPIAFKYPVLSKDVSNDILGTGHHSMVQIPGKDEYYIAYHRFGTPLAKYPTGKGYNRETCLAKVEFDENNLMKVITPTLQGLTTPFGEQPAQEIPVTGVTLSQSTTSLKAGESVQLTETIAPSTATNKAVVWSSDNMSAATVDQTGKVTAVKAGTANITVTTKDGNLSASCTVTVTQPTTGGGGSGSGGGSSTTTPVPVPTPVIPAPLVPTPAAPVNSVLAAPTQVIKVNISASKGTATVEGKKVEMSVKPYVQDGRTIVGLRDTAKLLQVDNKDIIWNEKAKTIVIKTKDKKIELFLNQKVAVVNGKKVVLDVAPQLKNGSTVLPVGHIARLMNINIQFNTITKDSTFVITK